MYPSISIPHPTFTVSFPYSVAVKMIGLRFIDKVIKVGALNCPRSTTHLLLQTATHRHHPHTYNARHFVALLPMCHDHHRQRNLQPGRCYIKHSSKIKQSTGEVLDQLNNSNAAQKTAKVSREIIEDVLAKNKALIKERQGRLVKDLKDKQTKVRERVEEIIERENILTIPNLLCVGRGLMAPYLGYVIIEQDYRLAMGLLLFAGLTDLLDGQIARRWPSQMSKMGSFLDPMADKLLIGSLVISLTYVELMPLWLTAVILSRDVFLIGAGFVIRYISLPPPKTLVRYFDASHATAQLAPTFISKVNTVIQLATVGISLGAPIWDYVDHPVLQGLWALTGLTTAAAALSYVNAKDTYKFLRDVKGKKKT